MLKEIYELLEMFEGTSMSHCFHRDELDRCIFQFGSLFDPYLLVKQDLIMCKEKPGYLLVSDPTKMYSRYLTVEQTYKMIQFLKKE